MFLLTPVCESGEYQSLLLVLGRQMGPSRTGITGGTRPHGSVDDPRTLSVPVPGPDAGWRRRRPRVPKAWSTRRVVHCRRTRPTRPGPVRPRGSRGDGWTGDRSVALSSPRCTVRRPSRSPLGILPEVRSLLRYYGNDSRVTDSGVEVSHGCCPDDERRGGSPPLFYVSSIWSYRPGPVLGPGTHGPRRGRLSVQTP